MPSRVRALSRAISKLVPFPFWSLSSRCRRHFVTPCSGELVLACRKRYLVGEGLVKGAEFEPDFSAGVWYGHLSNGPTLRWCSLNGHGERISVRQRPLAGTDFQSLQGERRLAVHDERQLVSGSVGCLPLNTESEGQIELVEEIVDATASVPSTVA